jgi:hypothetical protein
MPIPLITEALERFNSYFKKIQERGARKRYLRDLNSTAFDVYYYFSQAFGHCSLLEQDYDPAVNTLREAVKYLSRKQARARSRSLELSHLILAVEANCLSCALGISEQKNRRLQHNLRRALN